MSMIILMTQLQTLYDDRIQLIIYKKTGPVQEFGTYVFQEKQLKSKKKQHVNTRESCTQIYLIH